VADETLVYDLKGHRAHCLNRTAAAVWRSCDGRTPVAAIGRRLGHDTGEGVDTEVVWLALAQLQKAGLLDDASLPARAAGVSRRAALGRLVGAALLVPAVVSITAPTAGAAGSGGGQSCKSNKDCGPDGACLFGRCV
jgi:hypothetical protein